MGKSVVVFTKTKAGYEVSMETADISRATLMGLLFHAMALVDRGATLKSEVVYADD